MLIPALVVNYGITGSFYTNIIYIILITWGIAVFIAILGYIETTDDSFESRYPGGPANHFAAVGADGGWLSLQPDKLVFKPHAFNFSRTEWSIDYSDIADVKPGELKNLIIVAKSGKTDTFVVNRKQKWIEDIKSRMR